MRSDEVRALGVQEISAKVLEVRQELAKQKASGASGTRSESPGKIRKLRREIARMLTISHEKATGIVRTTRERKVKKAEGKKEVKVEVKPSAGEKKISGEKPVAAITANMPEKGLARAERPTPTTEKKPKGMIIDAEERSAAMKAEKKVAGFEAKTPQTQPATATGTADEKQFVYKETKGADIIMPFKKLGKPGLPKGEMMGSNTEIMRPKKKEAK